MGRYFVLTAAFGLLFNRKPCQVRFNSLQLQGSPWFHLFLADFSLDLFLVLLLLVFVVCFSWSFFVCLVFVSFSFGLLVVPFRVPLGVFSCFLVLFLFVVLFWVPFWVPLGFGLGSPWVPFLFCFWFCVFALFWVPLWPPFLFLFVCRVPLGSFFFAASDAGFMRNHLSNHVSKAIRLLTFA